MYISCIIIYRIGSIYKVSLTWDLKPRPLVLCSSSCSTELGSHFQLIILKNIIRMLNRIKTYLIEFQNSE